MDRLDLVSNIGLLVAWLRLLRLNVARFNNAVEASFNGTSRCLAIPSDAACFRTGFRFLLSDDAPERDVIDLLGLRGKVSEAEVATISTTQLQPYLSQVRVLAA